MEKAAAVKFKKKKKKKNQQWVESKSKVLLLWLNVEKKTVEFK